MYKDRYHSKGGTKDETTDLPTRFSTALDPGGRSGSRFLRDTPSTYSGTSHLGTACFFGFFSLFRVFSFFGVFGIFSRFFGVFSFVGCFLSSQL